MAGGSTFVDSYRDVLRQHLQSPDDARLGAAAALGRDAARTGTTLRQLVDAHLDAQRALAVVSATPQQDAADAFFAGAVTAYDSAQRGDVEARIERVRGALLSELTSAYLAVAAGATSTERCDEAVRQIELLLGAADARVDLGRAPGGSASVDGNALVAPLPSGSGRLVAIGPPGRVWSEADRAVLQQLAVLVHAPIIDARMLEFSERLERVGAMLDRESEPEAMVERLLDDGLDQTAAASGAILVLDEGVLRVAGPGAAGRQALPDVVDLDGPSPIATVVRSGEALFLPDVAAIQRCVEEQGLPRPEPSTHALALVSLHGPRGPVGAFEMRFDDPQSFDAAQRSFLAQVGARLGTALERAGTFAIERDARHQAEMAAGRVSDMRELATDLSHAATRRGVAGTLLRHAARLTGATSGLIVTLRPRAEDAEVLASVGPGGGARRAVELGPDALREVAATSFHEGALADGGVPAPVADQLRSEHVGSIGTYPLTSGSRQVGGLVLGWAEPAVPVFDHDSLRTALSMAGPVLRRAGRYDIDHDIAVTLQRSLLTVPSVDIPGITWAARYRSGSPGVAGGDWYDIVPLDRGRVAVVVGDIVGKGVQAAADMGQLRSATRALANHLDDPGQLIEALDDYVRATGQGMYSSLGLVVIDPACGTARYAAAGHPPLIVCTPDKTTSVIETGRGPLLGVDTKRSMVTLPVGPGDLFVLYTDGLIERRDRSLSEGLEVLVATLREGIMEPTQLCRHVMDTLSGDAAADDIAIVAVQMARD